MTDKTSNLGKLQSIYPLSPAHLQRAFILIILSFMFFMAMIVVFSIRQNIGYFILATAFLIVQLFTLFGWLNLRKTQVKIFENGLSYKKAAALWGEIATIESGKGTKTSFSIIKKDGEKIVLNDSIYKLHDAIAIIKGKVNSNGSE